MSARWLLIAVATAVLGAALCAWATLCLLFWQGSWQLLYHPRAAISRTPAAAGVPFESVAFAAKETGQLQIHGWWIPAPQNAPLARFTVLYLHGANGNLSDSVDELAELHRAGVNLLAFDYRGYGQSALAHPSEAGWMQDANWALDYLINTRHTAPQSIVLAGKELGADLAVEVGATHPELAGVILFAPVEDPASAIFNDSRAHLVPAHLLVKDRYDFDSAAGRLRIPSLWLLPSTSAPNAGVPAAFNRVPAQRQLFRLTSAESIDQKTNEAVSQWLMSLPAL